MAYKLTCSGGNCTYVGQTAGHLAMRIDEQRKKKLLKNTTFVTFAGKYIPTKIKIGPKMTG